MIHEKPRVRFAPSPTGYLHVGGLRTALYNYLFAKKSGGTFVLRIEDTDRKRFVEGAVENLIDALRWCGVHYDEGPGKEGAYGPYVQSQRLETYTGHVQKLLEAKKAYYCFCDAERLEKVRHAQEKAGEQKKYDKHCLSLTTAEVEERLTAQNPYVIRMNIVPEQEISFEDRIRGTVVFRSETLDDQVLLKSDGYPTYHLANVVDDHCMKITHVIRGEEWLPSTPKHVLLYRAFGWEEPLFAHLPLLLNPDRSKLSKRQGDVAVEDYRANGYLPDALVNFVALLGWTAGDDREFYKMDELIDAFSIERVNKSGAVFDMQKLRWLNAEHLRRRSDEEILPLLRESLKSSSYPESNFSNDYLLKVIAAMKERVEFVKEFWLNAPYFFADPTGYDDSVLQKRWTAQSSELLFTYQQKVENLIGLFKEEFESALNETATETGVKKADIIHPLRLALSGVGGGPGVFDIAEILGKETVIRRLKTAREKIIMK